MTERLECPCCLGYGRGAALKAICSLCDGRGFVPLLTPVQAQEWLSCSIAPRVRWCMIRAGIPVVAVATTTDDDVRCVRDLGAGALAHLRALFPFAPSAPHRTVLEDAAWMVIA